MGAVSPWAAYVKPLTDQMSAFGQDQQTRLNAYAAQNVAAQATVAKAQASPLLGGPLGYFLDSAHDTKAAAAAAPTMTAAISAATAKTPAKPGPAATPDTKSPAAGMPASTLASTIAGGADNVGLDRANNALHALGAVQGHMVSLADVATLTGAINAVTPHYAVRENSGDAVNLMLANQANTTFQAAIDKLDPKNPSDAPAFLAADAVHKQALLEARGSQMPLSAYMPPVQSQAR